jgi:septin family protein
MLGRKDYTQEELDHSKTAVDQQLAAYNKLVKAIASATTDKKVNSALEAFEALFFNNPFLALGSEYTVEVFEVPKK